MAWLKIDDKFSEHPKVTALSALAFRVHIGALCYAARNNTDGRVPAALLPAIRGTRRTAAELVAVGLWETADDAYLGGGWVIHDYLDYNPSAAELSQRSANAQRRWAINHDDELREAIRERDGDQCRYCRRTVNWRDRRGPGGGTYDHVVPVSQGGADDLANIVVSCKRCNSAKGARTPAAADMELLPALSTRLPQELRGRPGPDLHPIYTEPEPVQARTST